MAGKIADISQHQGAIYWSEARKELSYAIFRASIGMKADTRYLDYTRNCGLPYSAYHYVKAGTAQEAREEARVFVTCANKATVKPAIHFADIEFETQTEQTTEAVCVAFLDELRRLGCERIGLYINRKYKWAGKAIGMCDVMWIPHWGLNDGNVPAAKYEPKDPCDLWQFTSHGHVSGIDTRVDLNMLMGGRTLEWLAGGQAGTETAREDGAMSTTIRTAAELAARAIDVAKNYKTIYMYAAFGFQVTDKTIAQKAEQNLNKWYTSARIATLKAVANQTPPTWGFDCVNLYKALLWGWTGDASKERGGAVYASNGVPDTNADGLFGRCTDKSADFSKIEVGEALWMEGHFGLYIGDGLGVECTPGWKNGVQITAVKNIGTRTGYESRKWTQHGKLPYVIYDGSTVPSTGYKLGERTLKRGDAGDDVRELQSALVKLGYDLGGYGVNRDGVDGEFGAKTEAAIKKIQEAAGLEQSGIYGGSTITALEMLLTPPIISPEPETPAIEEPGGQEGLGVDEAPTHVLIIQGGEAALRKLMLAYGGTLAKIEGVKVVDEE